MALYSNWQHPRFALQFILICITCITVIQPSYGSVNSAIKVNNFTLDNGLHVIQHYRPFSNSITLQMVVDGGLSVYPCSKQQTPHVLEHMLLSETARYAEGSMRKKIKNLGGSLLGYTTLEYTHYSVTLHSDFLTTGLDILYSALFEPALSNETLEKSISAVHAELGTTDNAVKNLINNKAAVTSLGIARLYSGSNLDCTEQSSPSDISLAEVQASYDTAYHPANMTLIVVGNIPNRHLPPDSLGDFSSITLTRPSSTRKTLPNITPLTLDPTPIVEHGSFSDSRVHVNLLLPATGKSSGNTAAFQLISDYFGEILFNELRSRLGIAYTPRAHYIAGSDLGHIYVTAKTTPEREEQVTATFLAYYQDLIEQGIPEAEITRLKNRAILKFESKERKNIDIAQQIRHHRRHVAKSGKMPNILAEIQNLEPIVIKQVIDDHFPQQPVMATLRPLNNNELILRLLLIILTSCLIALPLFRWLRKRRQ